MSAVRSNNRNEKRRKKKNGGETGPSFSIAWIITPSVCVCVCDLCVSTGERGGLPRY